MAYYYLDHEQCDDYAVTPVLATPNRTLRYCEEALESSPYLPSCQKPVTYCYERKPEKVIYCNEKKPKKVMYCSEKKPEKVIYCSKGKPEKLYCTEKKPHKVMYYCEKEPQKVTYGCEKLSPCEECCFSSAKKQPQKSDLKPSLYNDCESNCKPVKTKYIIPCYRYEDGRIERYVPTRYGRLPLSAYRRNGIQDQIYGYRSAIRSLCASYHPYYGDCVHTAVEPMRNWYSKITQEVLPIQKKKDKK